MDAQLTLTKSNWIFQYGGLFIPPKQAFSNLLFLYYYACGAIYGFFIDKLRYLHVLISYFSEGRCVTEIAGVK
jgi:hypothetical protein